MVSLMTFASAVKGFARAGSFRRGTAPAAMSRPAAAVEALQPRTRLRAFPFVAPVSRSGTGWGHFGQRPLPRHGALRCRRVDRALGRQGARVLMGGGRLYARRSTGRGSAYTPEGPAHQSRQ